MSRHKPFCLYSGLIYIPNNIKLYTFDFQNPNKKVIYNNVIDKKYYCLPHFPGNQTFNILWIFCLAL